MAEKNQNYLLHSLTERNVYWSWLICKFFSSKLAISWRHTYVVVLPQLSKITFFETLDMNLFILVFNNEWISERAFWQISHLNMRKYGVGCLSLFFEQIFGRPVFQDLMYHVSLISIQVNVLWRSPLPLLTIGLGELWINRSFEIRVVSKIAQKPTEFSWKWSIPMNWKVFTCIHPQNLANCFDVVHFYQILKINNKITKTSECLKMKTFICISFKYFMKQ